MIPDLPENLKSEVEEFEIELAFKEIEKAFKPIHASLDHGFLNDIKGLNNPTSENLARWIWKELKPSLPKLSKVVVDRSSIGGAVYKGR